MRVADAVAKFVQDELGNDAVFALTGAGIMALTDGLALRPNLKTIFPHHEQTSSMAVDAYSRLTGKTGVAFFSTGPAATNAITGLAGCFQDSVPALFISGQVKRSESTHFRKMPQVRQFGVQELDILPVVKSLTKFHGQLRDPEDVLKILDQAVYASKSGRPGPSWVEIPMDVQSAQVAEYAQLGRWTLPKHQQLATGSLQIIGQIREMIALSRRPVVIAGQGIRLAGQIENFLAWVAHQNIPFVTPYLAIDTSVKTMPNWIGVTGVKGDRAANWAMQESDLILVLGSSMHVSVTGYQYELFAPGAKKICIDIDPASHSKMNVRYDVFLEANLKDVLPLFADWAAPEDPISRMRWVEKLKQLSLEYPVIQRHYPEDEGVNIYSAIRMVNELLEDDDCVISDAGSAFYAVSQALALNSDRQRYITSGAMATMGFSLPAAIGAAAAGVTRILAFTGDGSLQQNIQELSLLAHHQWNIKLLVLNNSGYLSIRASQIRFHEERIFGTDASSGVPFPDLSKLAFAYEIPYLAIDSENQAEELRDFLSQSGPSIVDFICPPNQAIIPTLGARLNSDGSMTSPSLSEMNPPLNENELTSIINNLRKT
jgi:acetolactate synthase-1/2/3 large subunit